MCLPTHSPLRVLIPQHLHVLLVRDGLARQVAHALVHIRERRMALPHHNEPPHQHPTSRSPTSQRLLRADGWMEKVVPPNA